MAKIRHVAMMSRNPEKLAQFYIEAMGLEEVSRSPGGVFLSDGYINLALLRSRNHGNAQPGWNHVGFLVDDVDGMREKLLSLEGDLQVQDQPFPPQDAFFEEKFRDPEGAVFDISGKGWAVGKDAGA